MSIAVIDSAQPALVAAKAAALKSQGLVAAILYINPLNLGDSKTVRAAHIAALHASGIDVGFVCEGYGGSNNFAHNDITAATGRRDGQVCSDYLDQLGAPDGTAVHPTIDNDVSPTQLKQLCIPYFQSFRAALASKYSLGAYGPGALLFALETVENPRGVQFLDFPWLSNATGWSRSHEYAATGRAAITQQRDTFLLGIDVDPNVLNPKMTDFGFWRGNGVPPPPPPSVHDTVWVQHALNLLKVPGTPLVEDGIYGPLTRHAVVAFQKTHGLAPDGIVGPLTTAAIEKSTAA